MINNISKIKECPCCGKINTITIKSKYINNNLMYRIVCDYPHSGCGMRTGWEASIDVAEDVWNRRDSNN